MVGFGVFFLWIKLSSMKKPQNSRILGFSPFASDAKLQEQMSSSSEVCQEARLRTPDTAPALLIASHQVPPPWTSASGCDVPSLPRGCWILSPEARSPCQCALLGRPDEAG